MQAKAVRARWKRWRWQDWGAVLLVSVAAVEMTWLSVRRVVGMNAFWYDLGTMTQAIGSVLRGQPLMMTDVLHLQNVSRLGGHAEVIYFAFAPLLSVFPSPVTLVVAQALLYALGGFAFYRIGKRMLRAAWGLLAAAMYLWYPVAQSAVLFDFHGDTLAMPLLAWALDALSARRWRRYYVFVALALLCKIYVVVPVFALGGVLWWKGARKHGQGTMLIALAWSIVLVLLHVRYSIPYGNNDGSSLGYLSFLLSRFQNYGSVAWMGRLITVLVVLAPLLFIASWHEAKIWLVPALSVFVPAFLTAGAYFYMHHHYALAVPFFVSAIIGLPVEDTSVSGVTVPRKGVLALEVVVMLNVYFVAVLLAGNFFVHPWHSPSVQRYRTLLPWLQTHVAAQEPVAATPNWSPFLALRPVIFQTFNTQRHLNEPVDLPAIGQRADAFVVDAFFEGDFGAMVGMEDNVLAYLLGPTSSFRLEAARDGLFIFRKHSARAYHLPFVKIKNESRAGPFFVPLDNGIVLTNYAVDGRFDHRYHEWRLTIRYTWQRQSRGTLLSPVYALTRLEGYAQSRALHLGTTILKPPASWQRNEEVTETVFLNIPHRAGCYPIEVGWYSPKVKGFAGSSRALVGKRYVIGGWWMAATLGKAHYVASCP